MTEIENINNTRAQRALECGTPVPLWKRISKKRQSPAARQGALRALLTFPFLLLIKLYQLIISPALHALSGPNAGCRYYPTCSCYAAESLRTHGLLRGTTLAAWRLLRCNPFTAGGVDPVPPAPARPRCQRIA